MNFKYEKFNYDKYINRLNSIMNNSKLLDLGLKKEFIGKTYYNYGLYDYVVGNGKKDLFLVGGMHGSEIISVDFVTQLLENIPELINYDPNLITLHIIPNINPEGFDITTSTLDSINDNKFKDESFDYYLRYRIDNITNKFLNVLGSGFKASDIITPKLFLSKIKDTFKEKIWFSLCDKRAIPKMILFEHLIMNIDDKKDFIGVINEIKMGIDKLIINNSDDIYFCSVLKRIEASLFSFMVWDNIFTINNNCGSRLYQEKFANIKVNCTKSSELASDISDILKKNNIPKGTQVKFDPTGLFINLNENCPNNPGIGIIKRGEVVYGISPSNNIRNYCDSPIGKPTIDPYNFTFCIENSILNNLFNNSYNANRLAGILLFHSAGGLIYSKMEANKEIGKYNDVLADAYMEKTDYKKVEEEEHTGYGDYLRQKYPGVLLIELSKMGGNPIAPYGDISNIERVITDNTNAIDNLISKLNELIIADSLVGNNKLKSLSKR